MDNLPVDPPTLIRGQEGDNVGNILGQADAEERQQPLHLGLYVVGRIWVHVILGDLVVHVTLGPAGAMALMLMPRGPTSRAMFLTMAMDMMGVGVRII